MANVLEDWYPSPESACSLASRHVCLTIDLISGFPYYFSSENPIGGIARIILVVRVPIEVSAYYFLVLPYCNQEKNLGAL